MQVTKKADSKGRLLLGANFANTTFLVEEQYGKFIIKKVVIMPAEEAWLFKNENAMHSLQRGLKEAKQGKFGQDPLSHKKNMSWLDEIED